MSWIRESDPSRHRAGRLRVGGTAMAILVAYSPLVVAQPAPVTPAQQPATDPAAAEVLFNDAKKAMANGDYESACPKLAESYRLDPGSGTLTALAVCHESQGKTATAWAEFIQVVSEAGQAKRADRERFAKQHIAVLEPKLSKLTINVDAEARTLPGLEVRRDGLPLGHAAWGTPVPVDPGDHTIEATADGKLRWTKTTKVGEAADFQTVNVPALEDAPVTAVPLATSPLEEQSKAPPTPSVGETANEPQPTSPQRTIGFVVGAVGLAAAGFGGYFGVEALTKSSQANTLCPNSTCSKQTGVDDESTAKTSALVADIALGGAIVALGVGTVLLLTAPHRAAAGTAASVAPLRFSVVPDPRNPGAFYALRF